MRSVVACLVAGCSFDHGVVQAPPVDDAPVDAPADAALPDAPPDARVCPPPPPTCTRVSCEGSTSCYYLCGSETSGKQNWGGAKVSCENAGVGCLATINDAAEQACLARAAMPVFPNRLLWFGWRQDPAGTEPGGGWGWECGSSSYVSPAWGDYEPNNLGGNEDCGLMTNEGGWNDAACTGTALFVCEL